MSSENELPVQFPRGRHLVQFTGDVRTLELSVGAYLREGAENGEWMIVIAVPRHREAFKKALSDQGVDANGLVRDGRLTLLDAQETLAKFMVDGAPDWEKFDDTVGRLVREVKTRAAGADMRAYGEMVDLLWKEGRLTAATRLEEYWNRLIEAQRFGLFCAYSVDLLDGQTPTVVMEEMLRTHSHLLPRRSNGELEHALERAMTDVLGAERVSALKPIILAGERPQSVPAGLEATLLWIRRGLPDLSGEILSRARKHYEVLCPATAPPS